MEMRKVVITGLAILLALNITGCAKKDKQEIDDTITKFEVGELAQKTLVEDNVNSETTLVTENIQQIIPDDASDDYVIKHSASSEKHTAEVAEVILLGYDNSEYWAVLDNDKDIQYGEVRYLNLNTVVNSIRQPYDRNTFINFIVKTYNPEATSVLVTVVNEEDPDTVPETMSMSISDQIANSWDNYTYILNKYGTRATWMMTICYENGLGKKAYLYGNKDYIVYAGNDGVLQIDMSEYRQIGPFEDTYKYVAPAEIRVAEENENLGDGGPNDGVLWYDKYGVAHYDYNGYNNEDVLTEDNSSDMIVESVIEEEINIDESAEVEDSNIGDNVEVEDSTISENDSLTESEDSEGDEE